MISFTHKGDFQKTDRFLHKIVEAHYKHKLRSYGEKGVEALKAATPADSGKTAESWSYEIVEGNGALSIFWKNSNVNQGVNIALILQYGHGTGTGGYVQGRDYINPAIQPIFDEMAREVWREVVSG
jgi:hypothetical protein